MKNESQIAQAQALALERFAFITQIQDLLRQGFPLSVALEQVSFRPLSLPDGGQRLCARRTIEDWWYDYQRGGFAALAPKVRTDKGQPRKLTAGQQKWILEQAQLEEPLRFPFRAKCVAHRAISPLPKGQEVAVVGLAPADECESEMIITVPWEKRTLAVPLAQLEPIQADIATQQAVGDWHYWVEQGYEF